MPVSKLKELPLHGGGRFSNSSAFAENAGFRSAKWGDMEVGYTIAPPVDCTPLSEGLPGGVCTCPHYGYLFRGRVRCRYPGTDWPDEVAETGDVYFFEAGHVLIYEEETEFLELNPAHALELTMRHIDKRMAAEAAKAKT